MSDWQSTLPDATCQADLLTTCKYHRKFKRWCGKFRIMTNFDCLSLRIGITSMAMKLWLQPGLQLTVSSVIISISECLERTYMYYHAASITHKYLSHIIFDSWSSTRESLGVYIGNKKPIDNDDNKLSNSRAMFGYFFSFQLEATCVNPLVPLKEHSCETTTSKFLFH